MAPTLCTVNQIAGVDQLPYSSCLIDTNLKTISMKTPLSIGLDSTICTDITFTTLGTPINTQGISLPSVIDPT